MYQSKLLAPTLREVPAEAEIISHQLLLRAGMIRKSAAGMYTYLPLAQRVLQKIMRIIREEMDQEGGQELAMPIVQPAEIWQESGRWDVYGAEMFRLQDRHQRQFCLGPTHEELITIVVKNEVRSYRDLPLRLYQIQNKYRDETRPRFGLMRGREFIMKDLYSFDVDEASLAESYQAMYRAYVNIFTRCGLQFRAVEADSGAIGGNASQEFMVLADNGEAVVLYCEACNYAANEEKAVSRLPAAALPPEIKTKELVATPGYKTIEAVSNFLKIPPQQTVKMLFYAVDDGYVAVLVRGNDRLNEIKLGNHLNSQKLYLAEAAEINEVLGLPVGYMGPIGLAGKVRLLADLQVQEMHQIVVGANQADYHYLNIEPQRDFSGIEYLNLRMAEAGEICPCCQGELQAVRGIEVGQIFKLGLKYSQALNATFLDQNGKSQPIVMGCYGIGVSRTLAAAIEQNYDQDGIKWPLAIAPFAVHLVSVNKEYLLAATEIYQKLTAAGVEVLLDDRDERAGVKFKDADLLGIPFRITFGKTLAEGKVEVKYRQDGHRAEWLLEEVIPRILEILAKGGH